MGLYGSFCILIGFDVSLWVLRGPYASLRIVMDPN